MARPISQNNKFATDIITAHMTEHPTTTRKQMVDIIANELQISPAAAGYYVDRACRPIFKALQQKTVDVQPEVEDNQSHEQNQA